MTALREAVAISLREQARRVLANGFHGCSKKINPPFAERDDNNGGRIVTIHAWIINGTVLCKLCADSLQGIWFGVPVPDDCASYPFALVKCGQKIVPRTPNRKEFPSPRDPYANRGYKPLNKKLARYLPNGGRV